MANVLQYQGYIGSVEFDSEDRIFHGRVLGITDLIGFEGESVSELEQDFRDAVDDYLETCSETGKPPERPFSGKLILDISPELLNSIAVEAGRLNMTIESWIADACRKVIEKRPTN